MCKETGFLQNCSRFQNIAWNCSWFILWWYFKIVLVFKILHGIALGSYYGGTETKIQIITRKFLDNKFTTVDDTHR
jgi:hypothetical protein